MPCSPLRQPSCTAELTTKPVVLFFLQEYIFLTDSDTKLQDINWDGSRAEPSSHPPTHSLQRPPTPPRRVP